MTEKEYSNEYVKYEFDESEKREIAIEMARKITELQQAEDEKKAIQSDLKSRIDGLDASIKGAATKLNSGYEYRNVKCELIKDFKNQIVKYMRIDTGEIVKERKMRTEDSQKTIDNI